jgi:hypothetical protein
MESGPVPVGAAATLVTQTPPLPAGHYDVTADVSASTSGISGTGEDKGVLEIDCWVTPGSAGVASNRDHVRISTYIAADIDALNVSDLLTTTAPGDRIDLACSTSNINANSGAVGDVWHASIIATPIADVNP